MIEIGENRRIGRGYPRSGRAERPGVDDGRTFGPADTPVQAGLTPLAQVAEQLALGPWNRRGIGIGQSRCDPIVGHARRP